MEKSLEQLRKENDLKMQLICYLEVKLFVQKKINEINEQL